MDTNRYKTNDCRFFASIVAHHQKYNKNWKFCELWFFDFRVFERDFRISKWRIFKCFCDAYSPFLLQIWRANYFNTGFHQLQLFTLSEFTFREKSCSFDKLASRVDKLLVSLIVRNKRTNYRSGWFLVHGGAVFARLAIRKRSGEDHKEIILRLSKNKTNKVFCRFDLLSGKIFNRSKVGASCFVINSNF